MRHTKTVFSSAGWLEQLPGASAQLGKRVARYLRLIDFLHFFWPNQVLKKRVFHKKEVWCFVQERHGVSYAQPSCVRRCRVMRKRTRLLFRILRGRACRQ